MNKVFLINEVEAKGFGVVIGDKTFRVSSST